MFPASIRYPSGTTTMPDSSPGQAASKALAIVAPALPEPTTFVRPVGGTGSAAGFPSRRSGDFQRSFEHLAQQYELSYLLVSHC